MKEQMPCMEIKMAKSPIALLKVGDRKLELIKVNRVLGKFFVAQDGVFELDGEYEYRLGGKPFYFYNLHNSKPLSLEAMEEVQNIYRTGKTKDLVDELEAVNKAIDESKQRHDHIRIMKHLGSPIEGISNKTRKFLVEQKLFDSNDIRVFMAKALTDKKELPKKSNKMATFIPSLLFCMIGIGAVLFMYVLPNFFK